MSQQSYTAVDVLNLARDLREDAYQGSYSEGIAPSEGALSLPDFIEPAAELLAKAELAITAVICPLCNAHYTCPVHRESFP